MGGIRLDQKASPLENVNAASSILLADTSSTATIKAERNKDAIEYQRNRVHNTRKVLSYVSLKIATSKYFIRVFW